MRLFLCILFLASPAWGAREALRSVYELAQRQSELLKITEARKQQADARKSLAVGAVLPTVTARYNYQEVDPLPGPASPFRRINQYSALVNLQQPIYRAGSFDGYNLTKIDLALQERLKEQEGIALWLSTGEAFYNLWVAKNDLVNVSELKAFSAQRVQELRERVKVGRSRKGELLQAEAQLAGVEADLARAKNVLDQNLEQLRFLVGRDDFDLDFGALPKSEAPSGEFASYLGKLAQRPDIKARAEEVRLNDKRVSIAKAGHQPTVDFQANYFFERTGILAESQWDIGVQVSLPLFQGGTVVAGTREAVERRRESELGLELARRQAARDVRVLWQNRQALDKVVADLSSAFTKARSNYEENNRDYRYGLVTNLDVLQALNQFIDTKRAYERALLERELVALQLNLAVGDLP